MNPEKDDEGGASDRCMVAPGGRSTSEFERNLTRRIDESRTRGESEAILTELRAILTSLDDSEWTWIRMRAAEAHIIAKLGNEAAATDILMREYSRLSAERGILLIWDIATHVSRVQDAFAAARRIVVVLAGDADVGARAKLAQSLRERLCDDQLASLPEWGPALRRLLADLKLPCAAPDEIDGALADYFHDQHYVASRANDLVSVDVSVLRSSYFRAEMPSLRRK